jgi:phospholipid/cholesterol/gamma-HCH transport system ATP-binding protein
VRGLTGPAPLPVLHDVSLAVPRGELHLVLGPMLSGKTQLLRHLVGLECATAGEIEVDGVRIDAAAPAPVSLAALRRRVGVLFARPALLRQLTAVENVELPIVEHGAAEGEEARAAAQRLLREVGLDLDDAVVPADLDRDVQRRVALARALALDPAVLLLDEPAAGLDPATAAELDELLLTLRRQRGFAVLLFSHDVRYAFGGARCIHVMEAGRIVADGDRDAIMRSEHPLVRRLLHRRAAS